MSGGCSEDGKAVVSASPLPLPRTTIAYSTAAAGILSTHDSSLWHFPVFVLERDKNVYSVLTTSRKLANRRQSLRALLSSLLTPHSSLFTLLSSLFCLFLCGSH